METQNIKMKIRSERYDVEGSVFANFLNDEGDDILECGTSDVEMELEDEIIELCTEGVMSTDGKKVELVYEESEITGMAGSRTSVSFENDTPGFVTMLREGSVSTALLFERGKRHHCVYNTPIMPFEICVRTIKVENNILSDGTLKLDYIIEIRGAKAERTKFELQIVE